MKTSVIKVGDMLSVWSLDEVESRIGEVAGVESVTVNFAAENATVRFDETRVAVTEIKSTVRELGLQSAKPAKPAKPAKDVAVAEDAPSKHQKGHKGESEPESEVLATEPKSKADVPAATHDAH